jgi:hypothetical protein
MNSSTIKSAVANPNPWEEVRRFNDGDIACVVMRQDPSIASHLPRYSYRFGRANGEHISPHIPIFARPNGKHIAVTFPGKRIEELIGEAELWIASELDRYNATR